MKNFILLLCMVCAAVIPAAATTWTIGTSGFTFSPAAVTVTAGDTIVFALSSIHNALEVDQATWNADGITALPGGFSVAFGGGTIILTTVGTHYYVCTAHALLGMKGTITVNPAVPIPSTITISSMVDQDGSLATSNDRIGKPWSLKLYAGSIAPGNVIDSVNSGSSLTDTGLPAGSYFAVEADSAGWTHISKTVDGSPLGSTSSNTQMFTVTSGENRSVTFINYAPHTIISSGLSFLPDSIAVNPGDTVRFVLDIMHNAREVSFPTWQANDTVSNGGFEMPFGGGAVWFQTIGNRYYVCQTHASFGMKGVITVFTPPVQISVNDTLHSGWNMISLPDVPGDLATSSVFPGAASNAFSYQGKYFPEAFLQEGTGYWLKSDSLRVYAIHGVQLGFDSIAAGRGWNMIGSISRSIATASVRTSPSGIILSHFFGYRNGYVSVDTIHPGTGYWIKTSEAGILILDTAAAALTLPAAPLPAGYLSLRDANGREARIAFGSASGMNAMIKDRSGLPPVPPAGAFDVRLEDGTNLYLIPSGPSAGTRLELSSVAYPITITWDAGAATRAPELMHGGAATSLAGHGELIVSDASQALSLASAGRATLPAAFVLDEAMPNPFNPSTQIRFLLPAASRVRMIVFNLLGETVSTLLDAGRDAGAYSVQWTPADLPSGVYFLRFEASPLGGHGQSFSRILKLMYQK